MKNQSKLKRNSNKYILIQDESGIDVIRVVKQLQKTKAIAWSSANRAEESIALILPFTN